jgi:guanylate kinase
MEVTKGKTFAVTGSSGAGKSTLIRGVMEKIDILVKPPSCTTRPPRSDDVLGKDYDYVTLKEFLLLKEQGAFLECFDVYGHCYGTLAHRYYEAMSSGHYPVKDVDTQGALAMKEKLGDDCITVFVKAHSLSELVSRVSNRDGSIAPIRLNEYENEEAQSSKFDYIILNDRINLAINQFESIIRKHMQ